MSKTQVIHTEQLYSISSYLRSAAGLFKQFAEDAMKTPSNPRLKEQFEKQYKEATEIANLLEQAEFAHLVMLDE